MRTRLFITSPLHMPFFPYLCSSIFGIYSQGECVLEEGDSADTILEKCVTNAKRPGTDLVAAGYCLYSSSTGGWVGGLPCAWWYGTCFIGVCKCLWWILAAAPTPPPFHR